MYATMHQDVEIKCDPQMKGHTIMKKGILYGVGVSPGDPELMTLLAVKTIKNCSVTTARSLRQQKNSAAIKAIKMIALPDK